MIDEIINIKPLFYISFCYLIIKFIKSKNNTIQSIQEKQIKKKKKKEFRLKKRKMIRALRHTRFSDDNISDNNSNDDNSNDDNSNDDMEKNNIKIEIVKEPVVQKCTNNNTLKATSKSFSIEEKKKLLDTSLWD